MQQQKTRAAAAKKAAAREAKRLRRAAAAERRKKASEGPPVDPDEVMQLCEITQCSLVVARAALRARPGIANAMDLLFNDASFHDAAEAEEERRVARLASEAATEAATVDSDTTAAGDTVIAAADPDVVIPTVDPTYRVMRSSALKALCVLLAHPASAALLFQSDAWSTVSSPFDTLLRTAVG